MVEEIAVEYDVSFTKFDEKRKSLVSGISVDF
jgi:hypothetical protein